MKIYARTTRKRQYATGLEMAKVMFPDKNNYEIDDK